MSPLPTLPVSDVLPALVAALAERPNAVLIAPPGAGKTTLAPLALLDAPWRAPDARIVMLEPRRIAARAAATRMASLLGEQPGGRVGYRTRLDSAVSEATRIEVVTEGLLVRRLLADPTLDGIGCVVLDEVHERNLDGDLALAFCLDLQARLRPELRILAMSATVDGARLAALLDGPVIESEGRMFPVEIRHVKRDLEQLRVLPDRIAAAVREALAQDEGDILAFLPGQGEIRRAMAALEGCSALVLPLHGELPPGEQDRALTQGGQRRVVLATSIAETSLTVPGVRIVIDGGYRRTPRHDSGTGLTRLETLRISRAAAAQRAGRAGREGPGIAIRLWTEATQRSLALHDRPEILESELAGCCLDIAAWRREWPGDEALRLPDALPAGAAGAARTLLTELGALDAQGLITPRGLEMARLGAHPRLAAMMLAARDPSEAALAADLAALLEERDPLRRFGQATPPADIGARLAILAGRAAPGDADRGALSRIRQQASRYRRRLRGGDAPADGDAGRLLAAAFPDRVAQRRGEPGAFRLSGGGGAKLPRDDGLADAPLLVAAALHVRAGAQVTGQITLAARLDPAALPDVLLEKVETQLESGFDPVSGSVLNRERLRLGALVLRDRTVAADPKTSAVALARAAIGRPGALDWSDAVRQFQARVALYRPIVPGLPDLSDDALAGSTEEWLAPHLLGMTRVAEVAKLDLLAVLRQQVPYKLLAALDRDLPGHLALPSGRATIDYNGPVPTASAKAQAFYGLAESPTLAGGRIKLQFALLSPAGRPAAITGDLAGFWRGAWADTRRDLRGRYPKHDWPEDPAKGPTPRR